MIIYIIPFIVTFFAAIKYEVCKYPDDGKRLFWVGMYIYLVSVIGLRYMVGGDSYFYMLYFNDISAHSLFDISWDAEYQPLFSLFTSISKYIYPSFTSFQILHALVINTCLFLFIKKNSEFPFSTLFLCLIIFYINFSVEILRESLAIIVFLFNYKNLEKKRYLRYLFGVLISVMFHLSAVFLLLLPFLKFLKINRAYIFLLVIAFFAVSQLQYLFAVFENVDKLNKKINDYSEASYGWKSTVLFFATRTLIPIGLFWWAKAKFKMQIRYEYLICVFGLLGVCSIFNTIIFTRFTNYIIPFYCIVLADVLIPFFRLKTFTPSKLFIMIFFMLILATYSYTSFYWPAGYYEKWVPYYSIFSDEAENNKIINRNY